MTEILRFAPSPTGYLHVGGARTAIFNWLIAKKSAGKFLLRIEDTDKKRSTQASIGQIFSSLQWLGLDWDNQVYFQSQHQQRHQEIAFHLLSCGKAYRCFCTKEELAERRAKAEQESGGYLYDRTCRSLSPNQIQSKLSHNIPYSIRLILPETDVSFFDTVIGETAVKIDTLDDFIVLRSDGTPVYQLAVVVDDHDMGVTKVLRGADHLYNTFKQILIYKAMDWPLPQFGHVPLILGPDKVRLSKRHGATSVEQFKERGVLPEALFNYLCLLGWSAGDDVEIMERSEIINKFEEKRIKKSAAVFDLKKLLWMNGKYISHLPAPCLMNQLSEWLADQNIHLLESEKKRFQLLVELLKIRSETIEELKKSLTVYFNEPHEYDPKGIDKLFKDSTILTILKLFYNEIKAADESLFESSAGLEGFIRIFAQNKEITVAKIIHPLRLSLTGKLESPGLFELIYILGRKKTLERLEKAIEFSDKSNEL